DRARLINERGGRFRVVVRGLAGGRVIDRVEECASISRALVAGEQWAEVLAAARSPDLKYALSNTTEAGHAFHPADAPASPRSFPATLAAVLFARWQSGGGPLTILPCELIEGNAVKLRGLVYELAARWQYPDPFSDWVARECVWLASLVDRIVPGRPVG